MGKMLVFSNAVEGRDDEYNEWYDNFHLKELTATAPFKSGQRFRVAQAEGPMIKKDHRYLAVYEFDGPPEGALQAMMAAAPNFTMSDTVSQDALIVLVEDY